MIIRFPVGELTVEAADVAEVRTEVRVDCNRMSERLCDKYRRKLRLHAERDGRSVTVRLRGGSIWKMRKLDVEGRVIVPRWAPLEVRMGIGEANIEAGDKGVKASLRIGDLTIRAPRETVGSAALAVRIGDASISDPLSNDRRRALLGARSHWEGDGSAEILAAVRIGDVNLRLD